MAMREQRIVMQCELTFRRPDIISICNDPQTDLADQG